MPIISIITALRPHSSEHVAETWESIRRQSLPAGWQWEWLVQIDGPGQISSELPMSDSRISFRRNGQNFGPAVSRNLALSRAAGDLIKVLDGDDVLTDGQLNREVETFAEHAGVVWTTCRALDYLPDGSAAGFDREPDAGIVSRGAVVDFWRTNGFRMSLHPATLCVRARELRAIGGWMALPASEDTGLLLTLNSLFDGYYLSEAGLLYRKWGRQLTAHPSHNDSDARALRVAAIDQRITAIASQFVDRAAPPRPPRRPIPHDVGGALDDTKLSDDPTKWEDLMKRIFRWLEVDLVVDAGAFVGEYSHSIREKVGYTGEIVSFEPNADSFETLATKSRPDLNWTAVAAALGSRPGRATMYRFDRPNLNSLHRATSSLFDYIETGERSESAIPVVRLDDWLNDSEVYRDSKGIFLKIDTQGHDLEVLRGATETLKRTVAVQVEVSVKAIYEDSSHWLSLMRFVESMGFSIAGMFPVTRDPGLLAVVEFDSVFVRDGL